MKPNHITPFLFLILQLFIQEASAQNRHFVPQQRILCANEIDGDLIVSQMVFDSTGIDEDPFKLYHINQRELMDCDSIMLETIEPFFPQLLNNDFHFLDSAGFIIIKKNTQDFCRFRLDEAIGTTYSSEKGTIVLHDKVFYQKWGLNDSAYVFHLVVNGSIDYSVDPMIFGQHIGWIDGGDFFDFKQVGYWNTQGQYQGIALPTWQDFYPEEAGDMKMWVTSTSVWGTPVRGQIDSFLQVDRYPDSIVQTTRTRLLNSDWTWGDKVYEGSFAQKGTQLADYLKDSSFACSWHKIPMGGANPNEIKHLAMRYSISEDIWTITIGFHGFWQAKCPIMAVIDGDGTSTYSEKFGYEQSTLSGYSYVDTYLHGAKVGNYTKGNLNVGLSPSEQNDIAVYPNPSSNTLYIEGLDNTSFYTLYTLQGKQVDSGEVSHGSIPVNGLENGIYMLQLGSGQNTIRLKIQVLH